MSDIDDLLNTDDVKDILEELSSDIEGIDDLIVIYTMGDKLKWRNNCRRSTAIGLLDIIRNDLLTENYDK